MMNTTNTINAKIWCCEGDNTPGYPDLWTLSVHIPTPFSLADSPDDNPVIPGIEDAYVYDDGTTTLTHNLGKNNYGRATAKKVKQDPIKTILKVIKHLIKAGYITTEEYKTYENMTIVVK